MHCIFVQSGGAALDGHAVMGILLVNASGMQQAAPVVLALLL